MRDNRPFPRLSSLLLVLCSVTLGVTTGCKPAEEKVEKEPVTLLDRISNIFLAPEDMPYITLQGKKPEDAEISVWVNFIVSGDECEQYSYNLLGRKHSRGGSYDVNITKNYSNLEGQYNFRVPYRSYINDNNCLVKLSAIKINARNDFDTSGFAGVRIYPSTPVMKTIEFKNYFSVCNENLWHNAKDKLKGYLSCDHYIDGKIKKSDESNFYSLSIDFNKFTDDTIINYDIKKGDNYRSEPLVKN